MADRKYTQALMETVLEMVGQGETDISCFSLAKNHWRAEDDGVLPRSMIDDIQKRLRSITRLVRKQQGLPICLVNERYFRKYNCFKNRKTGNAIPVTRVLADKCVHLGNGVPAFGIHLAGEDDVVFLASVEKELQRTNGAKSAKLNSILRLYRLGKLGRLTVRKMLQRTSDYINIADQAALREVTAPDRPQLEGD